LDIGFFNSEVTEFVTKIDFKNEPGVKVLISTSLSLNVMYKDINIIIVMNTRTVTPVETQAITSIVDGMKVSLTNDKTRAVGRVGAGLVVVEFKIDVGDGVVEGIINRVVEDGRVGVVEDVGVGVV
jgi:hypothetical protein